MNKIQVLSQAVADKIAAGEVAERPAAVVKELVENAIDAGADRIAVEIKKGGVAYIRVTDNGGGIPEEQVETAFLRHATSKLSEIEDLFRIGTMGFRGEALASICAVAEVEVITKTPEAEEGTYLELVHGVPGGKEPIACGDGDHHGGEKPVCQCPRPDEIFEEGFHRGWLCVRPAGADCPLPAGDRLFLYL